MAAGAKAKPGLVRGRVSQLRVKRDGSVVAAHVDIAPTPRRPLRCPAGVVVAVAPAAPAPPQAGADEGRSEETAIVEAVVEERRTCERPPDEPWPSDEARTSDERSA